MMKLVVMIGVLFVLFISGCHSNGDVTNTSLINLIATPDQYDEKNVQVAGYMHLEFEGNGLHLNRDDFTSSQYKNGVWISFDQAAKEDAKKHSDKYVVVTGVFHIGDRGHMGLWSGSIDDISRVYTRPSR